MLNMKKGLAIALAAATAFTFAPIASLSSTVTAHAAAATVNISLTLPGGAYNNTGISAAVDPTESSMGYNSIKAVETADGMEIDGLSVVSKSKSSIYKVAGLTNGVDSDNDISTTGTQNTEMSFWKTLGDTASAANEYLVTDAYTKSDTNGKIDLGKVYLHKGGVSTITLVDLGKDGKGVTTDGENITLTINADQNKQTFPAAHVYATAIDPSTHAVALTNVSTGVTPESVVANAEINPQGSVYFLDLNKYKPGYLLAYTNNGDGKATSAAAGIAGLGYTNWAGSFISVKSVELNAANRSIQWGSSADAGITWTYQTDSKKVLDANFATDYKYDEATTISNVYTASKYANGVVFKTTAATAGTDAIDVTFKGANGGSASTSVKFSTDRSEASIDDIYATVGSTKVNLGTASNGDYTLTGLDSQIHNAGKIVVKSESGDHRFISVDPSIITIDEKTGEFKVLKKGSTKIQVYVGSTVNNKPSVKTIDVTVSPWATDSISITSDANVEYYTLSDVDYLDLDVPDSKAANAVKSAQLKAVSAGGLDTTWKSSDTSVVTVDEKTGLVTAKKAGSATLTVSTSNSLAKEIWGTSRTIRVTVWTLPASVFTVAPVTVNVGDSALVAPVVTSPKNYTYTVNYDGTKPEQFNLTNPGTVNTNTQTSSRLTGEKIGTKNVLVTVLGTSENRPTTRKATVTVLDKTAVNVITMDAGSQSLVLKEGETAQLKGTASIAGKTVTFQNGDASIATVTTAGAVTAVKAGQTTVKAVSDGAETVEIPVVVVAKVNTPAQVTGVKVANVKGGKVKVTWTKDANSNVKYYVKKTVSGKSAGKSVGSNATTLTVKKGATVKVKVKAYVYDGANKLVGAYSTTVTKKTDKK